MSRTARLAVILAASQKRIQTLFQKYGNRVSMEDIEAASKLDPSDGVFLEWIVRGLSTKEFSLLRDSDRIKDVLTIFNQFRNKPSLFKQYSVNPDINKHSLYDLERIRDVYYGVITLGGEKSNGVNTIYNRGGIRVIQIGGDDADLDAAVEAACFYAKDTKWCTRDKDEAENYLDQNPLYVIFNNGVKIAQTSPDEGVVKNVKNKTLYFTNDTKNIFEILYDLGAVSEDTLSKTALESVSNGLISPQDPDLRKYIANSSYDSYLFARDVLHDRFPEGEGMIIQTSILALDYAVSVVKGRFPEGEQVIASHPSDACMYAIEVLKSRFKQAESVIAQDPESANLYVKYFPESRDDLIRLKHG